MQLWEMSDGRVWQVDSLPYGEVRVWSVLDDGALSMVGDFSSEADLSAWAAGYLRLTVAVKVR